MILVHWSPQRFYVNSTTNPRFVYGHIYCGIWYCIDGSNKYACFISGESRPFDTADGAVDDSGVFPLQMSSGDSTQRKNMPQAVHNIMLTMPATYFVSLALAILLLFRKTIGEMAWANEDAATPDSGTVLFMTLHKAAE